MSEPKKSFNIWPYAVFGGYGLFACVMIGTAIVLSQERVDLVTPDYYAHQIKYEAHLDATRAAARPGHAFLVGEIKDGVVPLVRPPAATDPVSGKPLTMRMDRIRGFRLREIGRWSCKHLAADAHVRSDGLACCAAVKQAGCTHEPLVTSGPKGRQRRKAFVWVDTILGNVKNALHGTYHAIRAKHLPRYLIEFSYRFNRRFDLARMVGQLGAAAALTPPMPYRLVKLAEAHW